MLGEEEEYLSVNWLENTGAPTELEQVAAVRQCFINKDYGVGASDVFAVLNVGQTIDYVEENSGDGRVLSAHHEPDLPHDESHSGIYGYSAAQNDLIADLIAQTWLRKYPARER